MVMKKLSELEEYSAAGLYEEPNRSLFYRKALGLRRFYENCEIPTYNGELLFPSGKVVSPDYLSGLVIDLNVLNSKSKELADQIKNDFFNVNKLCSDSLYRKKINKMDALRVLLLLLTVKIVCYDVL